MCASEDKKRWKDSCWLVEVVVDPESSRYKAIQDELNSIMTNHNLEPADLPKGLNPLGVSGCLRRSIIVMVF